MRGFSFCGMQRQKTATVCAKGLREKGQKVRFWNLRRSCCIGGALRQERPSFDSSPASVTSFVMKLTTFDPADYLDSEEAIAAFLEEAAQD